MSTDPDCIFCKIVAGEIPAATVADDDSVIAFMDINPVTSGHLLVVPKGHYPSLGSIPGEVASRMMETAQGLGEALRKSAIRTEGINLWLADGAAAGQEVFHAHLHVIPRWSGDGFRLSASRGEAPTGDDLAGQAAAIRVAID